MDNLVEVKPHIWLSKTDPRFYEKYFKSFPNDHHMRYRYGLELEKKGQKEKAYEAFLTAAKGGHRLSELKCADYFKMEPEPKPKTVTKRKRFEWNTTTWLAFGVAIFMAFDLILVGLLCF
jgi:hypothetical protein